MTGLGTLPGGSYSLAYGINDNGEVVGYADRRDSNLDLATRAFLYADGQIGELGTLPGYENSFAYGINDSLDVVGYAWNGKSNDHAFLWNGQMNDLGTLLVGADSYATAINDSGQVVGDFGIFSRPKHAFLYSIGQMTDLGTLPGGTSSTATAINDSGQVVGDSTSSNGSHAFLYSNGHMTDLGTLPGSTSSAATAINDSGQVVGDSTSSNGSHPFLYSNGHMTDLNTLLPANSGWVLTEATAINDSYQIVGSGTINGQTHAFLLNFDLAPSITGNPSNRTVTAGQTATFTAAASGKPTPTVQWQVSSDGGKTFTNLSGANSTTLTLSNVQASQNGNTYRAVFKNSVGTANTSAATLTVQSAPVVKTNPSDQTVTVGQTATFTAAASGNPTPTVQWQVSSDGGKTFTNLSGATSTTLKLNNATAAMNGNEYRAVFTNSIGTAKTSAAKLTVNQSPPPPALPAPPSLPPATPTLQVPPLLAFFNSILGATETVNGDGIETVVDSLFGIPLLVSTFDSTGHLVRVTLFGFDITFLFG
jgi:probable HAF family extracellular repeat protein